MEVANIYDNGPISPFARVQDKIAVWIDNRYEPYRIEWMEGLPASLPFVIDICWQGGNFTPLPAGGQLASQAPTALMLNSMELLHFRWEPLDDVEGMLFQQGAQPRYNAYGGVARTSRFTRSYDPWLATTTFYVLGKNKDVRIGVSNPQNVAQPLARFQFFGYRYIVRDYDYVLDTPPAAPDGTPRYKKKALDLSPPITYLPAQGR